MSNAAETPAAKPRLSRADRTRLAPRKALRRAREEAGRLRQKHAAAVAAGDKRKARTLSRILLRAHSVKIAAAGEAVRRQRGRLPEKMRPLDVVEAGLGLDMSRAPDEAVRLYAQPKEKGGWRPIHAFGIRQHARQLIFNWIVDARVTLDPRQHALKGGVSAAIAAAKHAIHHGARWAMEVDFTNCFGSIDREWVVNHLRGLAIPEQITRSVAFPSEDHLETDCGPGWAYSRHYLPGPSTLLLQARSGLPQGAASSSLLAEVTINEVVSALPATAQVVVYADNVLLMAPTRRELEALADTLGAAVTRHPAGRFEFKRGPVRRIADGFEFLGNRVEHYRGTAYVEPSKASMKAFAARMMRLLHRVIGGKPQAERRLRAFCAGWASAFALWDRVRQNVRSALFWGAVRFGANAVARLHEIMRCMPREAGA